MTEFRGFPKIARFEKFLDSPVTITEKIDGTNACIIIAQVNPDETMPLYMPIHKWTDGDGVEWGMHAQSRKNMIKPGKNTDNYGFASWVAEHAEELVSLGHGYHYGEWWGLGIQRNYGLDEKRLSLFNVSRPAETLPDCVSQVPILDQHTYDPDRIDAVANKLEREGSVAVPGWDKPEGVMVYLHGLRQYFKVPFDKRHKSEIKDKSWR